MSFIINSGTKIFEIIKILNKTPSSTADIIKSLANIKITADKRTVIKYLKTIKEAGFIIKFKNKKFNIIKSPLQTYLNNDESTGGHIFSLLIKSILNADSDTNQILFEKLKNNINSKQITDIKLPKYNTTISNKELSYFQKLSEYIKEPFPKLVEIKSGKKLMSVVIKEIKYTKNGIYLTCFNLEKATTEYINIKQVDSIVYTNKPASEFIKKFYKTCFKLKGVLKQNYILKDGEEIHYYNDEMLVLNDFEDKEELLSRILGYGVHAEVMYTTNDRKRFIEKTDELIEHFKNM